MSQNAISTKPAKSAPRKSRYVWFSFILLIIALVVGSNLGVFSFDALIKLVSGEAEPIEAVEQILETAADNAADNGLNARFALGAMIISAIVFLWLGRRLLADSFAEAGENARHQIALYAALILSAISFFTTAVGLYEFTEPDTDDNLALYVSWILSYATTAGVQILMLVLALELGDEILKVRPTAAPGTQSENATGQASRKPTQPRAREFDLERTISYVSLAVLLFWITNIIGLWPVEGILSLFSRDSELRSQASPYLVLPILLLAAGMLLSRLGVIKNSFGLLVLGFLASVYLGALAVSSTFSFDAYYRFVQSEEQIDLEQRAIVTQETSETISNGRTLLTDQISRERAKMEASDATSEVQDGIRNLILRSEQNEGRIAEEREKLQAEITRQLEELAARRQQIENDRKSQANRITDLAIKINNAERSLGPIRSRITRLQQESERASGVAQEARDKAEAQKQEAEAQRAGEGDRDPGEGPEYRKALRLANALEKTAQEREDEAYKITEDMALLEAEFARIEADIQFDRDELTNLRAGNAGDDNRDLTAQNDLSRAEEALNQSVAEVEAQEAALRSADTTAVSQAFSAFLSGPTRETRSAFDAECNGLRKILIDVGADLNTLATFNCIPGPLKVQSDYILELQNRLVEYGRPPDQALSGTPDAPVNGATPVGETLSNLPLAGQSNFVAPVASAANKDDALAVDRACGDGVTLLSVREALALARRCVELLGADVDGQPALANDLTLIESIYLKPGYDIRKSVYNILRGEPYAMVTAGFAVFIDLIILFSGIYIALSNQGGSNRPSHDVARDIRKIVTRQSELFGAETSGWAARQVLDMCDDHSSVALNASGFKGCIQTQDIPKPQRALVNDIVSASGDAYAKRAIDQRGENVIYLHDAVINFLRDLAYSGPPPPRNNKTAAIGTSNNSAQAALTQSTSPSARRKLFMSIGGNSSAQRLVSIGNTGGDKAKPDAASTGGAANQSSQSKAATGWKTAEGRSPPKVKG